MYSNIWYKRTLTINFKMFGPLLKKLCKRRNGTVGKVKKQQKWQWLILSENKLTLQLKSDRNSLTFSWYDSHQTVWWKYNTIKSFAKAFRKEILHGQSYRVTAFLLFLSYTFRRPRGVWNEFIFVSPKCSSELLSSYLVRRWCRGNTNDRHVF
jgi:hypothetical protein